MKEFIEKIRNQFKLACTHFFVGNIMAFCMSAVTSADFYEKSILCFSGLIAGVIIESWWYEVDPNSKNKTVWTEIRKLCEYMSGSCWFCLVKYILGGC